VLLEKVPDLLKFVRLSTGVVLDVVVVVVEDDFEGVKSALNKADPTTQSFTAESQ
jgi:hypothetical protein